MKRPYPFDNFPEKASDWREVLAAVDELMCLLKEGYIILNRNDEQTFGQCDKDWSRKAGESILKYYGFIK